MRISVQTRKERGTWWRGSGRGLDLTVGMGTLNTERERDRETLREEGRDRQGERNLVEGIGKGTRLDSRDGDLDFEYREGKNLDFEHREGER